jgi:hypothetical protein
VRFGASSAGRLGPDGIWTMAFIWAATCFVMRFSVPYANLFVNTISVHGKRDQKRDCSASAPPLSQRGGRKGGRRRSALPHIADRKVADGSSRKKRRNGPDRVAPRQAVITRFLTRLPSQYSLPLPSLIPKRARPCCEIARTPSEDDRSKFCAPGYVASQVLDVSFDRVFKFLFASSWRTRPWRPRASYRMRSSGCPR